MSTLLWFRRDLRVADHPALAAAAEQGDVLGVFVADDVLLQASGAPRRAFLAGCLTELSEALGGRLLVVHGKPERVVPELARAVQARAVHVSEDFGPYGRRRDEAVRAALGDIELVATGSPYAVAPGRVHKPDGSGFSVFAAFFRVWTEHGWRAPAESEQAAVTWIDPKDLGHRRSPDFLSAPVDPDMRLPDPGEKAALARWRGYLDRVGDYDEERNFPAHEATSRLSPYLKWGCVHPRTLLADLAHRRSDGAAAFRRELAFREFYADLLFRAPDSLRHSLDPSIDGMDWDSGPTADTLLADWKAGRTGYPYIDAGMRQLLAEGWIHNRVRMGVASFLIKDLHLPWQVGARHFMDHLVDGDAASNQHNWQWVAGSGPASAPFYRIFNPMLQGEKFDPSGDYVRRYVPELAGITTKKVHRPWELPGGVPQGYVERIVDHDRARKEAMKRFEARPTS